MIYLISKISKEAHKHNEHIASIAGSYFDSKVFIPHMHNPYDTAHNELEFKVFNEDLNIMKRADIAVISMPIGRDCAAEIGWFCGANKYVCVFLVYSEYVSLNDQVALLKSDWMIKGFISEVFVDNVELYKELIEDPIIGSKVTLLKDEYCV
jgi:nucleoside 2-deoxyribosyltransferase